MVTVRSEFDTLKETFERHPPNDEYETLLPPIKKRQPSALVVKCCT